MKKEDNRTSSFSLKNGLKVFLQSIPESKSVSIYLTVKAGPRYEQREESGLAHFLEHMLFEGTHRFNNAKRLAEYVEGVGGKSGAWTDKEYVTYYVKVLPEYVERGLDYLSDILFNSSINGIEIEKEKGIIIEEMNRRNENPEVFVSDQWLEWTWGDNQSIGRSTIGNIENIKKLKKEKIQGYLERFYVPSNMTIVIVGNFVEKDIKKSLENYFHIQGNNYHSKILPIKFTPKKQVVKFIKSRTEQIQICLGFVTNVNYFNEDKYVLWLISEILGGSTSSRLFYELIYGLGIAYTAGAYAWLFNDTGLFITSTGVSQKSIQKAIEVILHEIDNIKTELISEGELKSNKAKIRARLYYDFEATDAIAYLYSSQLSTEGKITFLDELVSKFDSVSSEEIRRIAVKYFNPKFISILILGNISKDIKIQVSDTINKFTSTRTTK